MKLAIDPYMFREVPLLQLPALVSDLGYEWIELSPREDFTPFFNHPRVDDATVKRFRKSLGDAGVGVSSILPLYKWSGPDEEERQAAVRYWKRAIEIASLLGVDRMNSEFNGNPRQADVCERMFWRSMEDLLPVFEKEGISLVLEPHPDDWEEDGKRAVDLIKGINSPLVSFLYCAPHTFHQGNDCAGIMEKAGDLLTMVHVADSFDHTGSSGLRYIVNPPGSQVTHSPASRHRTGRGRIRRVLLDAREGRLRRHRDQLCVRVGRARPRVQHLHARNHRRTPRALADQALPDLPRPPLTSP